VHRPKRRKPKIARQSVVVRGRYPNHVWAIDFQFDETADGRPVKIPNVTDEFTREALATNAAHRITAAGMMAVLDQIRDHRGHHSFCVWTTDQSSLLTLCVTGAKNTTSRPTIVTRVRC
jgi:transposase InsO family protein